MQTILSHLEEVEESLVEAAELRLGTPGISEKLYTNILIGVLTNFPMPRAPHHIRVLQAIKKWGEAGLLPEDLQESMKFDVIKASRGDAQCESTSDGLSTSTCLESETSSQAREGVTAGKKRKHAHPVQKSTLFTVLPGATKTLISAQELRKQREAALRDEDYEVSELKMATFQSEEQESARTPTVKLFSCPKCPRSFEQRLGLRNHMFSHSECVLDRKVSERELPGIETTLGVTPDGEVSLNICIEGMLPSDVAAANAAKLEAVEVRRLRLQAEAVARHRIRQEADEADVGEHRRGSNLRRQYTCKEKLRILAVFDEINNNPLLLKKVQAFHDDPRAKFTPYTTIRTHWASPDQRARIAKAASQEHAATLLRVDKTSRKTGKFAEMEAKLYELFKARRARGRRVSARWLTATGRQLLRSLYPDEEVRQFKGGRDWRRRFSIRFKLSQRRKTNCKNKNFADSEPVLIRYFVTLRRRLQLGGVGDEEVPQAEEVEPELDDVIPALEMDGAALDSSDDEDAEDTLTSVEMATPTGFKVAELPNGPDLEVLVYKGERSLELVHRTILFNWRGVGWVDGVITSANTDGRVKMKIGDTLNVCNFFAYYSDETEARHCLTLDSYR